MRNGWMIRKLRRFVVVPVVLGLLATAPAVYGGLRWTGMDPGLTVNGHAINVRLEWPEEHTCSIRGPMQVAFGVPASADLGEIEESSGEFDCDRDGVPDVQLTTQSSVVEYNKKHDAVLVAARVEALARFPVRVLVYRDEEQVKTCRGVSNHVVKCPPVKLEQ